MSKTFTFTSNSTTSFRELKKELWDITKIGNGNQDVQGWSTDLKLWMELQQIKEDKTIYYGCLLTSQGDAQRFIKDLKELGEEEEDISDEENSSDEESVSGNETEEETNISEEEKYPSFEKIVMSLKKLYGILEDQTVILKSIRTLKLKKNERIRDFNIRYRNLYTQLDKKKRKLISVLDYIDSIQSNYEAWKRVSLKSEELTLEKAFLVAEKVDRLKNNNIGNYTNFKTDIKSSKLTDQGFRENVHEENKRELENYYNPANRVTCFYCKKKGHFQSTCPELRELIDKNKKDIFLENNNHLNH